jgi:hypothetical protein
MVEVNAYLALEEAICRKSNAINGLQLAWANNSELDVGMENDVLNEDNKALSDAAAEVKKYAEDMPKWPVDSPSYREDQAALQTAQTNLSTLQTQQQTDMQKMDGTTKQAQGQLDNEAQANTQLVNLGTGLMQFLQALVATSAR